ncbi:MAG: hypothetical protein AB1796_15100, partial [Bacillota bacterium]
MGLSPSLAITTAVIAMFIPVIIVLIVYRMRLVQSSEDYFVAGRTAHWAIAMASVTSMFIWGSSVMGAAEGAADWGLAGVWIYPMYAVGLWVFGIWARKFADVFPYALSYTEYFRIRFDKKMVTTQATNVIVRDQISPGAKGMPRRASRIAPNTGTEFFLTVEI